MVLPPYDAITDAYAEEFIRIMEDILPLSTLGRFYRSLIPPPLLCLSCSLSLPRARARSFSLPVQSRGLVSAMTCGNYFVN